MSNPKINLNDSRWGDNLPWFIRYETHPMEGDFTNFFNLLCKRLGTLIRHNEAHIANLPYFIEKLESESLQNFLYNHQNNLATQIEEFFHPNGISKLKETLLNEDIELTIQTKAFYKSYGEFENKKKSITDKKIEKKLTGLREDFGIFKNRRDQQCYFLALKKRIFVLESFFRLLCEQTDLNPEYFSQFIKGLERDVNRFFANNKIPLIVNGSPLQIVPMEEQLLQQELIDKLLPRLNAFSPNRAKELISAYHDLIEGKPFDVIFINAFKTLEEIARELTMESKFEFNEKYLIKYFPNLHGTIHDTIIKLKAHRGDKAGHAKSAPASHEMRYLLFSVMNIALLLLDYHNK